MNTFNEKNKHNTSIDIQNALLELLADNSIENITVKQISEKAFISRVHFYNNFLDKYDVLETMEKEFFTVFKDILFENRNYLKDYNYSSDDELYRLLYDNTLKNILYIGSKKLLVSRMFGEYGNPVFINKLNHIYFTHFQSCLPAKIYTNNSKVEINHTILYITKGIFAILENWILSCFESSPEDISKSMTDLLMASLRVLNLSG